MNHVDGRIKINPARFSDGFGGAFDQRPGALPPQNFRRWIGIIISIDSVGV